MASPQVIARAAGALYVVTIVAGSCAVLLSTGRLAANLVAGLAYVGVTILFYFLFEPVSRGLSLLAALVSLAGCTVGALMATGIVRFPLNSLVFFGVYCLLIACLIYRSTFLPKFLAVLMAVGGVGWLTFLVPRLSGTLAPFNMLPGIFGETVLTLWLLIKGVDEDCWNALSAGTRTTPS
jgi:hypothetical protein